jgi:hypothetical protein
VINIFSFIETKLNVDFYSVLLSEDFTAFSSEFILSSCQIL